MGGSDGTWIFLATCMSLVPLYFVTDLTLDSNECFLQDGHIDMLSSDHSPTVPELKLLDEGNFLKAWGGISSLQVGYI